MKVTLKSGKLSRATARSACYDLFAAEDVLLLPGTQALVGTGVVTEMDGVYALILDRSGLAAKYRVSRRAGVIDGDFPGEWRVVLVNEGLEAYQVKRGDRIAQALFLREDRVPIEAVGGEVEESAEARVSGLGSTGK